MNILLIVPRFRDSYGEYYEFPLGLACISSMLKKHGYSVLCLNLNHFKESDKKVIEEYLTTHDVQIVATGGLSAHYNKINNIFKCVKEYDESLITILGGGIISSEPELIFNSMDIDYGVLNEGELTIVELVDALINNKDLEAVNGIIYSKNSKARRTPSRDSIADLDTLPFPDYESFGVEEYLDMQFPNDNYYLYPFDKPRALPVITTRSCPYSCTFCYHPLGKKYRINSLDYFFENLEKLIKKYQINLLLILDELFSVNKTRMLDFAQRIKKYNLKWIAQMRVDDVDDETLEQLKDSGLFYISYGLESASDVVLKSMKKKLKIDKTQTALELTKKHQIGIQGNFIFGDTAETKDTYHETIDWWNQHREYQINLGVIEAYPGTPIYLDALSRNLINDRLDFIKKGCPPINMTQMGDEEYHGMIQDIWQRSHELRSYGKVLWSKKIDYIETKGNVYEFEAQCPHCESKVKYTNIHKAQNGSFKLGCKVCNQRYDLHLQKVFIEEYKNIDADYDKLNEIIETGSKVALIPCIPEFKLISILNVSLAQKWKEINFAYFLDNNSAKEHQQYLNGNITIYSENDFLKKIGKEIYFLIAPVKSESVVEGIKTQLLQNGIDENKIVVMPNI